MRLTAESCHTFCERACTTRSLVMADPPSQHILPCPGSFFISSVFLVITIPPLCHHSGHFWPRPSMATPSSDSPFLAPPSSGSALFGPSIAWEMKTKLTGTILKLFLWPEWEPSQWILRISVDSAKSMLGKNPLFPFS